MARHVLQVEAPDTMAKCILRLVDISVYNPDVEIRCPQLYVTLPGFTRPVVFDETFFQPGFMLNLTACDLEIQNEGCGTDFNDLPDGIYVIKYSVSPNEHVFVEYNHLRITCALHKYADVLCELDLGACEPDKETSKLLAKARKAKSYLEAAKAKVEYCHEPQKGMELYRYAVKLLDSFDCKSCQSK